MKRIIALSLIAASLAATSAFGQGYFQFTSGKSQAYDGFTTPGASAPSANVNVALMWAAAGTTPTVDSLLTSTPTSGNSATVESYTAAQAWADINNGQFTLAVNSATSANVIAKTAANGSFSYNGGVSFGVNGTSPGTYTIYEVSWNAAYADPTTAAAAGSAVGWSAPIQYTAVNATGFVNPTLGQFPGYGTFVPAATPEPGTMALAGLGGLSMLAFRRRK